MTTKRSEPAGPPTPHGDVLIYQDSAARLGIVWNDPVPPRSKPSVVPVQNRHQIPPRLSFCPGAVWEKVSRNPSFIREMDNGVLEVLAGHDGDLAEEVMSLQPRTIIRMIEKSAGLQALERLQAMETKSGSPRFEVSEAIDVRKSELKVEMAKAKTKRNSQRRSNQRRSRRRLAS